jgi:hypothetical protein
MASSWRRQELLPERRYFYHFQTDAGIAQSVSWQSYGQDDRGLIPTSGRDFSSSPPRSTGSAAHPASYPMDTWGSFFRG